MPRARARTLLIRFLAEPCARILLRLHVAPNAVTLLGFLLSGGVAYLFATGSFRAGGALLLVSSLFDLLDGTMARLGGRASAFGALLDSVTDRLSEAAVLLGLLLYYYDQSSQAGVILVYLTLVVSLLVSYVRARGEGLGVATTVGLVTRPERAVILAVGALVQQMLIILGIVAALSFLTAGQRFVHVWRRTRSG